MTAPSCDGPSAMTEELQHDSLVARFAVAAENRVSLHTIRRRERDPEGLSQDNSHQKAMPISCAQPWIAAKARAAKGML